MKYGKVYFFFFTIVPLILLDHWTKSLILQAKAHLPVVATPFLNIVLVRNRGISFGLFQAGSRSQVFCLCALALVIMSVLSIWYSRSRDSLLSFGLLLIIAGAIGNIIDRCLWGSVVDFLDFYLDVWHFPAFNLADACITCGTGLVFWAQMREKSDQIASKG